MPSISFESNIAAWTRDLKQAQRQVPFATSLALTETAKATREHHRELLPIIFDRPTRYTINSLRVIPARKESLIARIEFKERSRARQHYLLPQVEGGGRPHKAFEKWLIGAGAMQPNEYAVPGRGARIDAHGNMSPGQITQILSQLYASPDAMQWVTPKSKRRARGKRGVYFVPKPGSALARGVWMRTGPRAIIPVLMFVRAPRYTARYDFDGISHRHAEMVFPRFFDVALGRALATSRRP